MIAPALWRWGPRLVVVVELLPARQGARVRLGDGRYITAPVGELRWVG